MVDSVPSSGASIGKLILVPSAITLGITVLRLAGELQHWPETFFNRTMGGSLVAIIWLAPVFGIYFALRLCEAGRPPKSYLRGIGYAVLGAAILIVSLYAGDALNIRQSFFVRLIYAWVFFAVSAFVTLRGWPELFKVMLAYGYAARIPVAVIMFFAMRGDWGTHYDAVPPDAPTLGLIAKYLWLGFVPQLVLWVAFTILAGMLLGTVVTGIAYLVKIERGSPV
jgi:hypothetical protein